MNNYLPEGLRPLETQVAGHTFQANEEVLGMLQDVNDGSVLKPLGKPNCEKRELAFYYTVKTSMNPLLKQLEPLVPIFYDKIKLSVNNREFTFVKLEDLTYGLTEPCIMDIKMGKRTWDPEATPEKRAVEEEKYAKCKIPLGLCIPGFQVYSLTNGKMQRYGKDYGKQLDEDSFRNAIALFLNVKPTVCVPFVRAVLAQLTNIYEWFSVQRIFHFYASSLLIVYDAVVLRKLLNEEQNGQSNGVTEETLVRTKSEELPTCSTFPHYSPINNHNHLVKIKMIDFAHVFPAENESLDINYLFGLKNLISIIEELLN